MVAAEGIRKEYELAHRAFVHSICEGRVTSIVAEATLADFPRNLPSGLNVDLGHDLKHVLDSVMESVEASFRKGQVRRVEGGISVDIDTVVPLSGKGERYRELFEPAFYLYSQAIALGLDPSMAAFREHIFSQELVMIFAHLEAFMNDTLRTICRIRPQALGEGIFSKRLVTGNGELLRNVVEVLDRATTSLSLPERLAILQDLAVGVLSSGDQISKLEKGRKLRNSVVHKGGRLVAKVPISSKYVHDVWRSALRLGAEVYRGVSRVLFEKK